MLALETISCADLATVTGAANESAPVAPSEPGVASRVWQGVKDVSGGFVARPAGQINVTQHALPLGLAVHISIAGSSSSC